MVNKRQTISTPYFNQFVVFCQKRDGDFVLAWWNKDKKADKPAKKRGFWHSDRELEYVEARIYERPGRRIEMKEHRPRRLDVYGRHSYR